MEKSLVIIDGNSLIFRAFYALPTTMTADDGTPTNAVYGFFSMLFNLTDTYHPGYLGVAFDKKGGTFRHGIYDAYKAGRRATPEDLLAQFPVLKNALARLGIATLELEGYEADDILGVMSAKAEQKGVRSYIVTGDRDALQLISDRSHVLITKKGVSDIEEFDREHLKEKWGIVPNQIVDMKSLMGDSSDNIPGIPGVGEKTALKLLAQYPTLDAIYENVEQMPKNKLREKIENNKDSAYLSYQLATIVRDAPVKESLEDLSFEGFNDAALREVLRELSFHSLMKRRGLTEQERPRAEMIDVTDAAALSELCDKCIAEKKLALVYAGETVCLACGGEQDYRVTLNRSFFGDGISAREAVETVGRAASDPTVKKVCHGVKALRHLLAESGFSLEGEVWDVMLAAYVEDPTARDYSVEKLADRHGLSGMAAPLFEIAERQRERIEKNGLSKIFYEIETPLEKVLFDMEQVGFHVDRHALGELQERYGSKIDELSRTIYELAGEKFNIASTKQLGNILFEKLGLPAYKKTKTGYSTDIEVLEKLLGKHDIVPAIIEYRQLTKLKSTYIDGLLNVERNGVVYTTFNQVATATGRISSAEPNLQNIPIRSDISHEIREVFVPSQEGNLLVSADYSQIELRVLAHIADDAHLKDAFLKNQDIHTRTASEVFGVPPELVTGEMRSSAKAVNFGIVYGISDFGLARGLGIPIYMAADYIKKYLAEFSGVRQYMERIVEQAKQNGYVTTLFGRRRYIAELSSKNHNTRAFGERAAMNTPIQGTAADIIKIAMVNVAKEIEKRGLRSRLILQVHDELIVDAAADEVDSVKGLLEDVMMGAAELSVPLRVNVAVGRTWSEAK